MSNQYFENAQQFMNLFSIESSSYENMVPLTDRKVGFSVQRAYPKNLRFSPSKTESGSPDTVAIIHAFYIHPSESKEQITIEKVPLFIRIGKFSRYRMNHLDYNFEDKDCPTEESIRFMKTSPNPVDLSSYDYFYNHSKNTFFNDNGDKPSGIQLLDYIFREHCDTIHWIRGIRIQWKFRSNRWLINILTWASALIKFLLTHLFGRTLDSESNVVAFLSGYKEEDFKKLSTESFVIFGYKASKSVIVIFSLIMLAVYIFQFYYPASNRFLEKLFSINLYSVALVISSLWFLDDILPKCLFKLLNLITRIRTTRYFF